MPNKQLLSEDKHLTLTRTLRVATPPIRDPAIPLSKTAMQYVPFLDSCNM
jgi:hypothetical protein